MAYIDKEKFKRKLHYIFKTYRMSEIITEKVKHALDDTTVDAVEVVRCKDCVHKCWDQEPCHGKIVRYCRLRDTVIQNYDFCSYGERKEK